MCMQPTSVRPYQRWHWAGDEIVHEPIIKAARKVPGTNRSYEIDIREYLAMEGNAVIRRTIGELFEGLSEKQQAKFASKDPGSFDFRAQAVRSYVARYAYQKTGRALDNWLFPDETLANGGGDCEDLTFLLASLLEASGISHYCIRVAMGSIVAYRNGLPKRQWDHAWVAYQTEGGVWEILEPLALIGQKPTKARNGRPQSAFGPTSEVDFEYVPHFVFNREHLWRVRSQDPLAAQSLAAYLKMRDQRFWKNFNPKFAIGIHESIYDEALTGMNVEDLREVKRVSQWVDVNTLIYDPRDHFDFGYTDESWAQVRRRLATGKVEDFALAVHGIADFYAHTYYAHFAKPRPNGSIPPYDPNNPLQNDGLVYDFTKLGPLPGCQRAHSPEEAALRWGGSLISGQWWRWFTTFPNELENAKNFEWRRCLPDHDAVAVDSPDKGSSHRLYRTQANYLSQFRLRRAVAIEHIQEVHKQWEKNR